MQLSRTGVLRPDSGILAPQFPDTLRIGYRQYSSPSTFDKWQESRNETMVHNLLIFFFPFKKLAARQTVIQLGLCTARVESYRVSINGGGASALLYA